MNPDTDEEKRIACAKALGWVNVHNTSAWDHPEFGRAYDDQKKHQALPDWAHDANAALTLCDVLAEKGWSISIVRVDKRWCVQFEQSADVGYTETADTLPPAIVNAFLKTLTP